MLSFSSNKQIEPHIAFFLENLDGGGAERAILLLAGEIAQKGYRVDFLVGKKKGDYLTEVSSKLNLVELSAGSYFQLFFNLILYLKQQKPITVMSALDPPNILLVMASKIAGFQGRVVLGQRAVVDASQYDLPLIKRLLIKRLQAICFPKADAVISNSYAASTELRTQLGIADEKLFIINNTIDIQHILRLAAMPIEDKYFTQGQRPLLVSVASLTHRKDFPTLIRAFKLVSQQQEAELLIIGKGPEKEMLEHLIADLGLENKVHLLGFDANPYRWMAAAKVCVSSSTGEGFPNVIAEALALSIAIVATDCPGDTGQLLEQGKWGRLVPVGDPVKMSEALLEALNDPSPPDGRSRAAEFSPDKVTSEYLKVLLPDSDYESKTVSQSEIVSPTDKV